jgi:hypothetical protein
MCEHIRDRHEIDVDQAEIARCHEILPRSFQVSVEDVETVEQFRGVPINDMLIGLVSKEPIIGSVRVRCLHFQQLKDR